MKRGYYYTVLLKAFKSIVRGSVISASSEVFLEIQLSHGIHEGWVRDPPQIPKSADAQVPYKMESYLHTSYALTYIYLKSSLGYL